METMFRKAETRGPPKNKPSTKKKISTHWGGRRRGRGSGKPRLLSHKARCCDDIIAVLMCWGIVLRGWWLLQIIDVFVFGTWDRSNDGVLVITYCRRIALRQWRWAGVHIELRSRRGRWSGSWVTRALTNDQFGRLIVVTGEKIT